MGDSGPGCCNRCFTFLFLLGLTVLFTWLAVRPNGPKCYVMTLQVPALNRTSGELGRNATSRNNTITIGVQFENPNKDSGVHYDGLNVTLLFQGTRPLGGAAIPAFYQGKKKTAQKDAVFNGTGEGWEAVFREAPNGTVVFRVVLATWVRYKVIFWNTGHHSGEYVGDISVDVNGMKEGKKGVKLK